MIQILVAGLPNLGIPVQHLNFLLSNDTSDIGRWRPSKVWRTLGYALRTVVARFSHRCDVLYYVPAPGKRGALYRDWIVMLLCRPFFRHLVLHWHAAGLGEWIETKATRLERGITRALLGRAELAIVLAEMLRSDGERLCARRIAVVPNGIADPGPVAAASASRTPCHVLFLGLCSEAKGLFKALAAVIEANRREAAAESQPHFVLTVAGPFADAATAERFHAIAGAHHALVRYVGVVDAERKRGLFELCHCLCLPTDYVAEAQPLVLLEALAHDRPIVATRWRGIPEVVSPDVGGLISPGDFAGLVDALLDIRNRLPVAGSCRARYLERFTADRHLAGLASALRGLE